MNCPNCGADASGTKDTRDKGDHRWRRRECRKCLQKWSTIEVTMDAYEDLLARLRAYDRLRDTLRRELLGDVLGELK